MSRRCERSRRTGAVVSPSTTIPICAAASSGVLPWAISSPARRLRPRRGPARDHQVAHAGEARERVRTRARGLGEPSHLGKAARDERRLRVVAEAQAVRAARGERDDVLRGRAQLDAGDVVAHVDAEDRRVRRQLETDRELEVVARDDRCGREPAHDLVGDVRAGEDGDRASSHERREPLAGRRVEALREAQDRRRRRAAPTTTSPNTRARHGDERRARRRRTGHPRSWTSRCRAGLRPGRSADCGPSREWPRPARGRARRA